MTILISSYLLDEIKLEIITFAFYDVALFETIVFCTKQDRYEMNFEWHDLKAFVNFPSKKLILKVRIYVKN